jgi:hypothetical protein
MAHRKDGVGRRCSRNRRMGDRKLDGIAKPGVDVVDSPGFKAWNTKNNISRRDICFVILASVSVLIRGYTPV